MRTHLESKESLRDAHVATSMCGKRIIRRAHPLALSGPGRRPTCRGCLIAMCQVVRWQQSNRGLIIAALAARDGAQCRYCGKKLYVGQDITEPAPAKLHEFVLIDGEPYYFATIDHIVPRSKGGPDSGDNLCLACSPCNGDKGALLLEEWGVDA